MSTESTRTDACVRLWFSEHLLRTYRADHEVALRYAAAIGRRFPGLIVTVEPCDSIDDLERLPCEQLWAVLTP
ncbi:hypothetical protein GCM10028864_42360 [Microlunatus parietis]